MDKSNFQQYKQAKTISEQLQYLNEQKRVQFNEMNKEIAGNKLLEYNYINVITPFKHQFAKLNSKKEVEKVNGKHVYERDIEFQEYYNFFINERKSYPIIITNILDFEIHFKTSVAYNVLTNYEIQDSNQLELFLDKLNLKFAFLTSKYKKNRIEHMSNRINALKKDIFKYADVYCFFDRMSLGDMLTVFACLDNSMQNRIFQDLKKFQMTFNVDKVPDFIDKVFCLVSIRNCVMHCNSLEILIRFYNPKTHELRKISDRKKYLNMIKNLNIEKTHDQS